MHARPDRPHRCRWSSPSSSGRVPGHDNPFRSWPGARGGAAPLLMHHSLPSASPPFPQLTRCLPDGLTALHHSYRAACLSPLLCRHDSPRRGIGTAVATEVVEVNARLRDHRWSILLEGIAALHHCCRASCLVAFSSSDTMPRDEESALPRPHGSGGHGCVPSRLPAAPPP